MGLGLEKLGSDYTIRCIRPLTGRTKSGVVEDVYLV